MNKDDWPPVCGEGNRKLQQYETARGGTAFRDHVANLVKKLVESCLVDENVLSCPACAVYKMSSNPRWHVEYAPGDVKVTLSWRWSKELVEAHETLCATCWFWDRDRDCARRQVTGGVIECGDYIQDR